MTKDMSEEKEWQVKCAFLESRLKEAKWKYEQLYEMTQADALARAKLEDRLSQAEAERDGLLKSRDVWKGEIFQNEILDMRKKTNDLEARLSQAEAELEKYAMVCQHPCGHWVSSVMSFCTVCRDKNTIAELEARLSHLMDVAWKMADVLKPFSDSYYHKTIGNAGNCIISMKVCEDAKAMLAEWDGIKEGG